MTLRFGTDGVRGVANTELTVELVTALGRAAARVLGTDAPFVVGRDTRRSGPMLEAALVAGICAEGADVLLAGVLPTPGVAFLARERRRSGCGDLRKSQPVRGQRGEAVRAGWAEDPRAGRSAVEGELRALATEMPESGASGRAVGVASEHRTAFDDYVAHLVDSLEGRRLDGLQVVIDCGHGAAFRSAPAALRALGAEVDVLNASPDGTNVNAGCGSTDTTDLRDAVRVSGAGAGLGFDGDADRVIAVDERGEEVDGDQMLAISAIDLHDRGLLRGDTVVSTVMSNLGLRRALAPYNIELIETPVGDRNVLDELERRNLALGGEQSGHVINTLHSTTGDGALTGILLLDVMCRRGRALSELATVMTPVPQVLRNVAVDDPEALNTDPAFWNRVRDVDAELGDDGRVLVRPSGTEPVVRVMVEAADVADAEAAVERLVDLVEHATRRSVPATS